MSYIIEHKATGNAVFETWNPQIAAKVNLTAYRVWQAGDWLREVNRRIREAQ